MVPGRRKGQGWPVRAARGPRYAGHPFMTRDSAKAVLRWTALFGVGVAAASGPMVAVAPMGAAHTAYAVQARAKLQGPTQPGVTPKADNRTETMRSTFEMIAK